MFRSDVILLSCNYNKDHFVINLVQIHVSILPCFTLIIINCTSVGREDNGHMSPEMTNENTENITR